MRYKREKSICVYCGYIRLKQIRRDEKSMCRFFNGY